LIREDFLQQSAFHEVDTFCPEKKQYEMLRIILNFFEKIQDAIDKKVHIDDIIAMKSRENLARMSTISNKEFEKRFRIVEQELDKELDSLTKGGKQ